MATVLQPLSHPAQGLNQKLLFLQRFLAKMVAGDALTLETGKVCRPARLPLLMATHTHRSWAAEGL